MTTNNEILINMFEMLIERIQNLEDLIEKQNKHTLLDNMCHCQILTLEVTKETYKLTTRTPVFKCKTCGWDGAIKPIK